MQSGISASKELQQAFNELVSSPSQRGLLAGIDREQLVPIQTIPLTTPDFLSDVSSLDSLLKEKEAAYVILRRYDAPDGFVAVTYVPDTANVRQKMLFASTRLTLVRELGTERFRETLFATTKEELTAEGWKRHDQHGETKAPLTEEEQSLQIVKEAEAEISGGTTARSNHVKSLVHFPVSDEAMNALKNLKSASFNLVQLRIDVPRETIELADTNTTDPDGLSATISSSEPRYSFYRYSKGSEDLEDSPIVFIYTCPGASKIKERMVYSTSRASMIILSERDAGLVIAKKLEASEPSEISASVLHEEFHPKQEQKTGFARPKRPGRR
ncbi:actin depolymerizing protein [Xylona heveae TC161]|uniref:Twinfilin n=1 Tax=Xylona heveae (strain CBS 132557 / TC161) TaxID=1328760 RepID=A0A165FXP2_XYLHT|nr:actin depolymerizing protein [Xylona heveae TC161]KZF21511.1 actin depolymerizing protein [Xylona heveae TC161]